MFDIKNNVKNGISMGSGNTAQNPPQPSMTDYNNQQPYQNQQPPMGQQPYQNQQPPMGQQPYQNQQPPMGQQPYQNQQPPMGQQPYQNQQSPMGQQPYQNQQPPMGQQPYQNQQPPMGQQPAGRSGVSLVKGQKVNLSKMNPGLDFIQVCLGWDVGENIGYDLDSEVFLLGADDRIVGDNWFVFYNQPMSPDAAVKHSGDNKTGQGDGDDEIIQIRLSQVSPQVQKMVFIVTINDAKTRGYHFGNVRNAFIRVVDLQNNIELVRFQLSEYYKEVTSMMVGELYKKDNEWRFNPVGAGTGDDLEGLCRRYGVNLL